MIASFGPLETLNCGESPAPYSLFHSRRCVSGGLSQVVEARLMRQ
jgi:hypothetical protein